MLDEPTLIALRQSHGVERFSASGAENIIGQLWPFMSEIYGRVGDRLIYAFSDGTATSIDEMPAAKKPQFAAALMRMVMPSLPSAPIVQEAPVTAGDTWAARMVSMWFRQTAAARTETLRAVLAELEKWDWTAAVFQLLPDNDFESFAKERVACLKALNEIPAAVEAATGRKYASFNSLMRAGLLSATYSNEHKCAAGLARLAHIVLGRPLDFDSLGATSAETQITFKQPAAPTSGPDEALALDDDGFAIPN